jgi:hypothetical protein
MRAAAVIPLLAVGVLAVGARPASAFEDFEGTRALAMGGATRAWALGDSAVLLNPSGMSLAKIYNVEASYAYGRRLDEHFFHASIVDSTSASTLGGGLYYTYRHDEPGGYVGHGHEVGAALSLPLGPRMAVGATGKWLQLVGVDDSRGGALSSTARANGLTFDVGATVRPTENFSFAVVGANLYDLQQAQAPRMLGYGAAFLPTTDLVVALDGVTIFGRDATLGRSGTGVRAGAEASIAQRVALRAGFGTDPTQEVGYAAAGVSLLSEVGAVDVGARGDVFTYGTGVSRSFFVGVSLRLFVPGAVASASPGQSP